MGKLTIPYPVIVEGKYDKIKLQSVIDADIFTTDGFGIFSQKEKSSLFQKLAEKTPIIILTDSDGGGTVIRNFFNSVIEKDKLIHLYTPQVAGKERRKTAFSKAGTLGVEGIDCEILYNLFSPFSVKDGIPCPQKGDISKTDFYNLGLSGKDNSATLRADFAYHLALPRTISSNALITALNILYTRQEFIEIFQKFAYLK